MTDLYAHTIFNNVSDFPNKVVIRVFRIQDGNVEPTEDIEVCNTIEEARAKIPLGLVCMDRDPSDHPSVVETWL